MEKPDVRKYEAPRAVELSDAKIGTMHCTNGRMGNMELCDTGFAINPNNVCANGLLVII